MPPVSDNQAAIHPNHAFIQAALEWLHEPTTTMRKALDFYKTVYDTPGCDNWTIAQLGRGDRFFSGCAHHGPS